MHSSLPFHRVPLALAAGEVHVRVARLAGGDDPGRLERFRGWLDDRERQRLDRLANAALKAEFLLTRALCRDTLSRYTEVAPRDWRFEPNAYGKPSIAAPSLPVALKFNLSNARTVVACAVTVDAELGIDIEPWNVPAEGLPISAQVFSPSELQALHGCEPGERSRRFHELWTVKEAYVKAVGQGMSMPLDQISFEPRATPIRASLAPALAGDARRWHFELIDCGPDHLLALAVGGARLAPPRITVSELALDELGAGFD